MPVRTLVSRLALVAALGAFGVVTHPSTASAQSLSEALASAYNNNPTLLSERANLRATDENVPQALSGWRPTVQVTGTGGVQRNQVKQNSVAGTAAGTNNSSSSVLSPNSYGLTVTQPVYRGGRTVAQTSQALNLVQAERATLAATEQTVMLNVITAYVNVVQSQATVDLNLNNEQVLRRQLDATQDRFRVGEVTRTDVAQAEASYAQAIASRIQAQGTLQSNRAIYEQQVGLPPGKLVQPTDIPPLPTSREEAVAMAGAANPSVISAQFAQQAAQDNIRVVRGQLLPQISVQGSVQRSKESQIVGRTTDSFELLGQVTVPLYEAGSVYSQSRQAQQTVAQRRNQVDVQRRTAVENAAAAWETLLSDRATIKSQEASIRSNEIALEGVQQEAAVGSRTVLDILNQEQTLFQSRVNLVNSQHDEVIATFQLISAVGRLTAQDLNLPVEIYNPDKNFNGVRDKWIGFDTPQ
ncbi:MAG TPA: TolC family outer membrane protein [Stellaceae bacterium]|nr:TolC family outer membrane protein [Stellaceae bacterium]